MFVCKIFLTNSFICKNYLQNCVINYIDIEVTNIVAMQHCNSKYMHILSISISIDLCQKYHVRIKKWTFNNVLLYHSLA